MGPAHVARFRRRAAGVDLPVASRARRVVSPSQRRLLPPDTELTVTMTMTITIDQATVAAAYDAKAPALAGLDDRVLLGIVASLPLASARRAAACEVLVARYQGLVWACVRRYLRGPEPADDLMQVG